MAPSPQEDWTETMLGASRLAAARRSSAAEAPCGRSTCSPTRRHGGSRTDGCPDARSALRSSPTTRRVQSYVRPKNVPGLRLRHRSAPYLMHPERSGHFSRGGAAISARVIPSLLPPPSLLRELLPPICLLRPVTLVAPATHRSPVRTRYTQGEDDPRRPPPARRPS